MKSFALWQQGYNELIDVSATYPVDAAASFQRGGHRLFGTARDYLRYAQMLANGDELDGLPIPGTGFGLGSRVVLDVAQTCAPGSIGDFGWAGAAKTYYWVDPVEEMVGIFMTQSMTSFDLPELDLQALAYGAIID